MIVYTERSNTQINIHLTIQLHFVIRVYLPAIRTEHVWVFRTLSIYHSVISSVANAFCWASPSAVTTIGKNKRNERKKIEQTIREREREEMKENDTK